MAYVWGLAKLRSSAGDVGTLAMVSFRPSVDPMPMDASERTDTASDQDRSGNVSWCRCWCCRLTDPAGVDGDGDPGALSDRRLGDRARADMAGDSDWRYEPFRVTGCRWWWRTLPAPTLPLPPSLLSLPLLIAVVVVASFRCRCAFATGDAFVSPKSIRKSKSWLNARLSN